MRTSAVTTEKQEAIESLRTLVKPGDKIYTILRHVTASGMSRAISCFIVQEGGIVSIDWYVERALGYKRHKSGGIVMGGAGMDMGFALVYNLGRACYPDGFKLAKGQYGRNGDKSGVDKNGGYAFKQKWM